MTTPFLVSYAILWLLVLLQCFAIFVLYYHFGQMALNSREGRDRQGPEEGAKLEHRELRDLSGRHLDLPTVDVPGMLIFTSTKCAPCEKLRPDIDAFLASRSDVHAIVICSGLQEEVRQWARTTAEWADVVPDPGNKISSAYGVGVTPFCIVTDRLGIVRAKGLVNDRRGLDLAAERAFGVEPALRTAVTDRE